MSHIYDKNSKRARLQREVMANYQKALENIDPDLLDHARAIITDMSARHRQDNGPEDRGRDKKVAFVKDETVVDRKKNLGTIMRFLALKGDSPELRKNLQSLFSEDF